MVIESFRIQNFKSIQDMQIVLDRRYNVLTGANNSGKTTVLEAIALWGECFEKLIRQAGRASGNAFAKGDYIFNASTRNYFDFAAVSSVRSPNCEDIFRDRDTHSPVVLSAKILHEPSGDSLVISFSITSSSHNRYVIRHEPASGFSYAKFNKLFTCLPESNGFYFSSPVANIEQRENFVTEPIMKNRILVRKSYEVLRNRLYQIYHHSTFFSAFQSDLSYVLYGSTTAAKIVFRCLSDITRDEQVVITYLQNGSKTEKDIALLGSGTLQVIEILLNVYHVADTKKDLNIILLDEPDSHIHRDIQRRLAEVLNRTTPQNQLIVTTHNESLIRSTPLQNLFHIDGSGKGIVKCLYKDDLGKTNTPHFEGLFPSRLSPVIASIGGDGIGMNFVSAIESERIFFVEGEDDARMLHHLFMTRPVNQSKKIMFWVLGGVSKILSDIASYKLFFSKIKNSQTLWDKSAIIFDRDDMTDEHLNLLLDKLSGKVKVKAYANQSYTQEAVLLSDSAKLSLLLKRVYGLESFEEQEIAAEINRQISLLLPSVITRMKREDDENALVQTYKGRVVNKLNATPFECAIRLSDIKLEHVLVDYYSQQPLHKLATKDDVAVVINGVLKKFGVSEEYQAEQDFYRLAENVIQTNMFDQWTTMVDFMSDF